MSVAEDVTKLEAKCKAMEAALSTLVKMYVANLGTRHEFISCITPRHASAMSKRERKESETWAAWDAARAALGWPLNHEGK